MFVTTETYTDETHESYVMVLAYVTAGLCLTCVSGYLGAVGFVYYKRQKRYSDQTALVML